MTNRFAVWAMTALLLLFGTCSSCAGTAARDNVLLPAMQNDWQSIRTAVDRQVSTVDDLAQRQALAAADAALQTGNPAAIAAVPWQLLDDAHEADVVRRIAAGEISPGVADSLRERLRQFAIARQTMTRTP
jgi:hypothetical protein